MKSSVEFVTNVSPAICSQCSAHSYTCWLNSSWVSALKTHMTLKFLAFFFSGFIMSLVLQGDECSWYAWKLTSLILKRDSAVLSITWAVFLIEHACILLCCQKGMDPKVLPCSAFSLGCIHCMLRWFHAIVRPVGNSVYLWCSWMRGKIGSQVFGILGFL